MPLGLHFFPAGIVLEDFFVVFHNAVADLAAAVADATQFVLIGDAPDHLVEHRLIGDHRGTRLRVRLALAPVGAGLDLIGLGLIGRLAQVELMGDRPDRFWEFFDEERPQRWLFGLLRRPDELARRVDLIASPELDG